jgi:rod shape-determining protein MreD
VRERILLATENRWFRLVLVALPVLGLQTTILNDMRPFGVSLQVMLLLAAASGLARGSEIGAIAGFVVGLLHDLVLTTPLGLGAAVFGLVGYLAGYANSFVHAPTWWTRMIMGAVASAAGMVLLPLALEVTGTEGALTTQVLVIALTVAAFNAVAILPAHWVCRWALREQAAVR